MKLLSWLTLLSSFISAGYSIAAVKPDNLLSLYCVARSIPLAIVILGVLAIRHLDWIIPLGLLMALVQLSDAAVGAVSRDVFETVGPAVLGVIGLVLTFRAYRMKA